LSQLLQISQWLDHTAPNSKKEDKESMEYCLSIKQRIHQLLHELHFIHETFLVSLESHMDKDWSVPFSELSNNVSQAYLEYITLMFGKEGYRRQLSMNEETMALVMAPIAQLSIYGSYIMDGTVHSLVMSRHWNFTRIKLHQLALTLDEFCCK
jgi:hypothetical protein